MHGDKTIKGKHAFSEEIHKMKEYVAAEMTLSSIITHGREAAANGYIIMGDKKYAFCDVYTFVTAASNNIKTLDSYIVSV